MLSHVMKLAVKAALCSSVGPAIRTALLRHPLQISEDRMNNHCFIGHLQDVCTLCQQSLCRLKEYNGR
ncbi:hypothetical protein PILCRDRAFT_500673 [Piloderma croceum F 1598]|uniref:Uncharacterized protein n=1 Tax=Piloderma croceum (strain F 1598) TaxID=765440 RepID=A0A0C3FNS2_PILCF|nr:hypothetical protein PILCRDRAFT_500673 [Piloderma croceum F 1598]